MITLWAIWVSRRNILLQIVAKLPNDTGECVAHLKLASSGTVQAATVVTDSRVYVAFHHFDNRILMDHGSVVDTISY